MIARGVDSNNNIIPLLLDASGNVIVSASQLTTTGGKLLVDSSGRLIVNSNMGLGSSPYVRTMLYSNTTLAAGTNSANIATVTAGETWQVDQIAIAYVGTVANVQCQVQQTISGNTYIHCYVSVFVAGIFQVFNVNVLSDAGTVWSFSLINATLNDDLHIRVFGRVVK